MRNILGGLVGSLFGTFFATTFFMHPTSYPEPFNIAYFVLNGAYVLEQTIQTILAGEYLLEILIIWIAIGVVISPFSRSEMNAIRTCLWLGVMIASLAVASVLLTDSGFWTSPDRNITLLLIYLSTVIVAFLPLITAVPIALVVKKIRKEEEIIPPSKIETVCECGAVFRSIPLICAECGRKLVQSPTLPTDSAS